MTKTPPVMLCILDGFGWREERSDNAVALARTPVFDRIWASGPRAFLSAGGRDVGLPDGQFGNSEVGHLNIGAGRVVHQDLPRIDLAIEDGSLARNAQLLDTIATLQSTSGTLHLMGLLSPGGVHSHQRHIIALAHVAADHGVPVVIHGFLDGRDVAPQSAADTVAGLLDQLHNPARGIRLGTLIGRYYAMDRDNRWERVTDAYHLLIDGAAFADTIKSDDPVAAIRQSYANGISDEFVRPIALYGYQGMQDGDGLLMANFRADRARELLTAFTDDRFDGFTRRRQPALAAKAGMVSYSTQLDRHLTTLFAPQTLDDVLGAVVSAAGKKQLRAAETEKYPHVTFFLNGGEEAEYAGEDRILVPSPKVATYDLQPEMSAPELTAKVAAAIDTGRYDLIVINYANPDMVGHTGSLEAAIAACEAVDTGLGVLLDAIRRQGGYAIVTADHGNCELMRDPDTGGPHTAHTTNPVPVVLVGAADGQRLRPGKLADLAPTVLALMGLPQPAAMTGQSLLQPADAGQSAA